MARLACLLFCLSGLVAVAQEPSIAWEPDLRLTWQNFRGTPPASKRIAATTASGISYQYNARWNGEGYVLDLQVETLFYPEKSWYHPEVCTAVTLSHEQLHFDITEWFARKFRQRLSGRVFGENVKAEVRRIFEETNRELSEFQDRYDRETDFSRSPEAQEKWNREMAGRLRK